MSVSALVFGSRNVGRDGVVWNSASSLVFALQSYVLMLVAQIAVGGAAAGVVSLASAQAYLFWTIGGYSMRRFQVSDVARRNSFVEYVWSRAVTVAAMVVVAGVALIVQARSGGFGAAELAAIALVTGLRVVDVAEDVVYADLQRGGRLHAAGRVSSFRSALVMVVYAAMVFATHDLVVALAVSVGVSALVLVGEVVVVRPALDLSGGACRPREVWSLLWQCFPLFAGGLLVMYLNNAPKYAIQAVVADPFVAQAVFGFLVMPVFVINLVGGFVYNPMIVDMAQRWRDHQPLWRMVGRVTGAILGLTVLACGLGYLVGTPVLSVLCHTDLRPYRWQFAVLLLGGGFTALMGFATVVLTVVRRQLAVLVANLVVAAACLGVAAPWVRRWGLDGACTLSAAVAAVQALALAIVAVAVLARGSRPPAS